jgi:hypothetical protein
MGRPSFKAGQGGFVMPQLDTTRRAQQKKATTSAIRHYENQDPNRLRLRPKLFSWEQEGDR